MFISVDFIVPVGYQGFHSPNFNSSHVEFRNKVRKFVEEELKPNVDDWIESGETYPNELHVKAYALGINGSIFPKKYGGTPPPGFDTFHEIILWDELQRVGGGFVLGALAIDSMALPPILLAGSDYLKDKVAPAVISGRKHISLCISEPGAGSDVANIQTTAELDETGQFYTVNGSKKWITGMYTNQLLAGNSALCSPDLFARINDQQAGVCCVCSWCDCTHLLTFAVLRWQYGGLLHCCLPHG